MSGFDIQAEVAAGIADAGLELGDGSEFTVTLRKISEGGSAPWMQLQPIETDVMIAAVVSGYRVNEVDGETIRASDKKVIMAAGQAIPVPGDVLFINGKSHRVMDVGATAPSGIALIYTVQARA